MRAFWSGFLAGMALPLLWAARLPLALGWMLFAIPALLAAPSAKAGLRLMAWDDSIADVIAKAWRRT